MKNLKMMAFAITLITLTSCSNDDSPVNEEELITTVITTLTGGGQTITLTARDLDGDGPNAPMITVSGDLVAGTTYAGATRFLNELNNPVDEITEEVQEEGAEHQVFYQLASNIGTVTYHSANTDANGNPIGLQFTLTTSANNATSGTFVVTLIHLPNKTATGVAAGDITNAGGATDALAIFPLTIL